MRFEVKLIGTSVESLPPVSQPGDSDYLHDLRVQFACQQLADPDVALSAIATSSGFADQSHFTRVFKQCTGMTPGAFRAMSLSKRAGGGKVFYFGKTNR